MADYISTKEQAIRGFPQRGSMDTASVTLQIMSSVHSFHQQDCWEGSSSAEHVMRVMFLEACPILRNVVFFPSLACLAVSFSLRPKRRWIQSRLYVETVLCLLEWPSSVYTNEHARNGVEMKKKETFHRMRSKRGSQQAKKGGLSRKHVLVAPLHSEPSHERERQILCDFFVHLKILHRGEVTVMHNVGKRLCRVCWQIECDLVHSIEKIGRSGTRCTRWLGIRARWWQKWTMDCIEPWTFWVPENPVHCWEKIPFNQKVIRQRM